MEREVKKEALRQYVKFFWVWFLAAGISVVIIGLVLVGKFSTRGNDNAPEERVYDYADVLTDDEEEKLRSQIEKAQKRLRMDIVIVTVREPMEGGDASGRYVLEDYQLRYTNWEYNMQSLADDFWDQNQYGYNQGWEGDGILLLHNWYPGQNGEHLSTSGKAIRKLGAGRIDQILNKVDEFYETDPYRAYSAFIEEAERQLGRAPLPWFIVIAAPILIAGIFAAGNMSRNPERNAVPARAYVANNDKPVVNGQQDVFLRKSVSTRHIESSSSGGSRSSGSSGGSHHSSSGASHGGGSHRH